MTKRQVVFLLLLLTVLELYKLAQASDTSLDRSEKKYFFSDTIKLNWYKAVEFCRSRGMYLLSIRNAAEREAVVKYLESTGYPKTHDKFMLWMSANDVGEEGEFHWASTGERVNYLNWSNMEPNNFEPEENCVVLEYWAQGGSNCNYTFNDRYCTLDRLFLCETLLA
ncbi:C-type lectin 37Db-like [Anopheles moucheti]|uniref:C-type lectin 37Db-like n=1 Tax=Anopheles moucheti TaxID=186751 RepID=UPI0022F0E8A3|nr:C-type lectin 37Db-like [Anopheles moucheti]